ncbi:hypothetical protein E3N88_43914 [Mikania micrantha]|uniref:Uncharacterized protein n=1 Tax=Mikania micrantha TaxID=192012 RepID=A0A5N6LDJ8_9ASTR|nr:hypothetical protein E3N88_43914 [Mikania micrantha]
MSTLSYRQSTAASDLHNRTDRLETAEEDVGEALEGVDGGERSEEYKCGGGEGEGAGVVGEAKGWEVAEEGSAVAYVGVVERGLGVGVETVVMGRECRRWRCRSGDVGGGGQNVTPNRLIGLSRSGKSCRLRWVNYLRPDIKHGNFTKEEDDLIVELHQKLGNKWSEMAAYMPGRSDNEIKNRWHTHLKKRAKKDQDFVSQNEHIQTMESDQANTEENNVQNSDLEFQQEVEMLLAESPLYSSNTNLPPCWFTGFDFIGSSDNMPQLTNYTATEDFWTQPFLPDSDTVMPSDNLFLSSEFVYTDSHQDMIITDEFLW